MTKFIKKPIVIISIIIIGGGIGIYLYSARDKTPDYNFIIVERADVIQEVSVTGRVKPVEDVDIAFETSGKIAEVRAKVGNSVSSGQILARLANAELAAQLAKAKAGLENARAQLQQYQSALAVQRAKLDELKRGTRPEEMQIAESKVTKAKIALANAEINLRNVREKAELDLANVYKDVPDVLHDAFTEADDAVNKQTDEMFSNDTTANPKLTFTSSDAQAANDAEWQRYLAGKALDAYKTELDALPLSTDHSTLETALDNAENHLAVVRDFLLRLNDALNAAAPLSGTTLNTYKGYVTTARTNVNTALTNLNNQKQTIEVQKAVNRNAITAAATEVDSAKNALALAENELSLKLAGATAEEIAAQEAKVAQAEANIASQNAQIKQAEANIQNYQAQIEKTILRAPINGLVTKQDAKVGEIISANEAIISIISKARFKIESNVPEADIAKVKMGDSAKVTLDAYTDDVAFNVKVVSIDPAATIIEGVPTYKVTLHFDKEDRRIKSGMTANIDILTAKRENVISIPLRAVIVKNGRKFVRVLNENIKTKEAAFKEVNVKTGLRGSDGNVEITEGIKEGDKVIIFLKENNQ